MCESIPHTSQLVNSLKHWIQRIPHRISRFECGFRIALCECFLKSRNLRTLRLCRLFYTRDKILHRLQVFICSCVCINAQIRRMIIRKRIRKSRRLLLPLCRPIRMRRQNMRRHRQIHNHLIIAHIAHRMRLICQSNTHLPGTQHLLVPFDIKLCLPLQNQKNLVSQIVRMALIELPHLHLQKTRTNLGCHQHIGNILAIVKNLKWHNALLINNPKSVISHPRTSMILDSTFQTQHITPCAGDHRGSPLQSHHPKEMHERTQSRATA